MVGWVALWGGVARRGVLLLLWVVVEGKVVMVWGGGYSSWVEELNCGCWQEGDACSDGVCSLPLGVTAAIHTRGGR